MKRFIKSFFISLFVGLPLILGLVGFMYFKTNDGFKEIVEIDFQQENFTSNQNTKTLLIENSEADDSEPETDESLVQPADKETITLSFAGDVHFSDLYLQKYEQNGISVFADEEMLELMRTADLFMLNHEFSFSLRGEAVEDKEYTLRSDPKYVKILQELGTDVVSIANNHVLDFGQTAFLDTLET